MNELPWYVWIGCACLVGAIVLLWQWWEGRDAWK